MENLNSEEVDLEDYTNVYRVFDRTYFDAREYYISHHAREIISTGSIKAPRYDAFKYAVKEVRLKYVERPRAIKENPDRLPSKYHALRRRIKGHLPHPTLHWNLLALIPEIYFHWQRDKRNVYAKNAQGTSVLLSPLRAISINSAVQACTNDAHRL